MRKKSGILLILAMGAAGTVAAQVTSRVVAYSGMPAPGASPATFDNFNFPVIAPQGEIVFRGRATGSNGYGLWRETTDQGTGNHVLALVQREGTPSPVAGFNFSGFSGPPTINLAGRFAFKAHIQSGSTFHDTLWVEKTPPTTLALVAREGSPAPGVPGANFAAIFVHAGYDPLLLDDSGRALFAGKLAGAGITAANDTGLWFYDGTTVSLVAREGDPMPGVPSSTFIDTFSIDDMAFLADGVFVFFGSDGDPVSPVRGLWSNHSGSVDALLLEGGFAPGLAGDETLTSIGAFRINANHQVAFEGTVEKDDGVNPPSLFRAVWISDAQGTPALAARSDQQPPAFRVPHVSVFTDGGAVFGVDENGRLGKVTTSGLTIVAKPGDPAPGTSVTFAAIDAAAMAANAGGQVAFAATVSGSGVNTTNDRGLWALDGSQLVKVAREGETVEAPAGTPRTITGIEFGIGVGSGQPRGMSDRGEIVWRGNVVGLPNGSQVVAVTGIGAPPEPPKLEALEVVQVIQDWRNEIPLVAGKKTVVRAHVSSFKPLKFVGRLRGFVGSPPGAELPGSPLDPDNPGGYVNAGASATLVREQFDASLHFQLPKAWTAGTVTLRLEWANGGMICREFAGPVTEDCQAVATFLPVQTPRVRFLGIPWLEGTDLHASSVDQATDLARRTQLVFPSASVDWDYRESGLLQPVLPTVEALLPIIKFLHAADGSPKRLYYGVVPSQPDDRTLGIASRDSFWGVGHAPVDSGRVPGRQTHSHELIHELGRSHSVHSTVPGSTPKMKLGACGETSTKPGWNDFPNWFTVGGVKRPTLGPMDQGTQELTFGLDLEFPEVAVPTEVFDLMSYCRNAIVDRFPSDWTYAGVLDAINTRFAPAGPVIVGSLASDLFVVRGTIHRDSDGVELHPFATLLQTEPPPAPPAGEYLLRLRGGSGALLDEIPFEPDATEPEGEDHHLGPFLLAVPANPAIRRVEVVHGGAVLASRAASAHAPAVQVTSPNGGETLSGATVHLQWTGTDTDGDPLTYVVQYSRDNGATWTTLGADLTATSADVPRASLPATAQGRLRVSASDGFLTASDASNATFTVANNPPFARITEPVSGRLFVGDQRVTFEAMSFDPENGNLADNRFAWSSSVDGPLGTDNGFGLPASGLTPGTHLITVTATDLNGATATDTATIRIAAEAAGPLADLAVGTAGPAGPIAPGFSGTYVVTTVNHGPDDGTGVAVTFTATLDPEGAGGPAPAPIGSVTAPGWNCTPGTGSVSCTRAALAALASSSISIQVGAAQAGSLSASAQITGAEEDPATGNNQSQATTAVAPPASADLAVTKTHAPASPLVGQTVTYTLTVSNDGPDPATGVTLADNLPSSLVFVGAVASQGSCSGTSAIACELGTLSSGGEATVTIQARRTSSGAIGNTATVSGDQPDPAPGDNASTDNLAAAGAPGAFGMHIAQFFGGTPAAPDAQYAMLRIWAAGQGGVGGQGLSIADADGTPLGTFSFPAATVLPNGNDQASVLIATPDAVALFGVAADLTMSPVTAGGGAKICWAGTTDCLAIGNYTGPATGTGNPFAVSELVGLAYTRRADIGGNPDLIEAVDDTNDSARDFVLALPAPRNNAGQAGVLPASTCGNDTLEGLEDCDDGDLQSGDGCSSLCLREPDPLLPSGIAMDASAGSASDGNGVLEPGETAELEASWRNLAASSVELGGAAAVFTGPAGTRYAIRDGLSDYGNVEAGETSACSFGCFQLRLTSLAQPAARPSTHWDASLDEVVSGGGRVRRSVHIGDSFTDVPRNYLFYRRVETVLHHGITAGCAQGLYCPNDKVRRDQMGLFLARSLAGGGANIPVGGTVGSSPYNCVLGGVSLFSDVAPTDSTCRAIHYIAAQNVTGGCGGGAFCVSSNVTRAEMGLFVARGLVAPGGGAAVPLTYGPDPVTGRSYSCAAGSPNLNFTDITPADAFCKHVHYLWAKGIVSGCTATQYCVAGNVTRGEMARFLSTAFAPNLYGP